MILSDWKLESMLKSGRLIVTPIDFKDQIQPASVDVRLGEEFKLYPPMGVGWVVDPEKDNTNLPFSKFVPEGNSLDLMPGQFVLSHTKESVRLPTNVVARVEGKSSLARLGLVVHATAGFIDPGFEGHITLEMTNLLPYAIKLRPGMKIAQISFQEMDRMARRPYGHASLNSKYQGQQGATASRYHRN